MPVDTDVSDRIVDLLEKNAAKAFTSEQIAGRLKKNERTVRRHLLALTERKLILREFQYEGVIGSYRYFARPATARTAR